MLLSNVASARGPAIVSGSGVVIGAKGEILTNGYAIAAALMLVAALIEALFGIDSEGRSLEEIADPLSSK